MTSCRHFFRKHRNFPQYNLAYYASRDKSFLKLIIPYLSEDDCASIVDKKIANYRFEHTEIWWDREVFIPFLRQIPEDKRYLFLENIRIKKSGLMAQSAFFAEILKLLPNPEQFKFLTQYARYGNTVLDIAFYNPELPKYFSQL